MNEQLGKIPFIHMENGLDYIFKFAGKSHKVAQKNHYQQSYESTLRYAKKHAMRVFYVHHLKRDKLPRIFVKQLDMVNFNISWQTDESHINKNVAIDMGGYADEYTQAFDIAIFLLLRHFMVEGIVE